MSRIFSKIGCILILEALLSGVLTAQSYWQQEVDYLIQVKLDDSSNTMHGHIIMHYTNNSPNSLPFIYIHLMPDAYGSTRSALNAQLLADEEYSLQFANQVYRGYIDSLNWKVEGDSAEMVKCPDSVDVVKVILPTPVESGQSIRLETSFYVKIPSTHISRLGYKDYSYYLTQWYPKPAVYDSYGWHPMCYLDKGEYYSEFGNYEVHITVPENFVVAASGDLITAEEQLNLDTLAAFTSTYVYPTRRKQQKRYFEPSNKTKTITYQLFNAHDFAFCADPDLLLLKDTVKVDDQSILVQTFVKRNHLEEWKNANQFVGEAIQYYSEEVGPYPYHTMTVVDVDDITGGDMEYPTIAWIKNYSSIEEPIVHHTGHNWFYGAIATNERDEHWLDEGLNSFYEARYFSKKYPDQKIHYYANMLDGMQFPWYQQSHSEYYMLARENKDQPSKTTCHLLSADNYLTLGYSKPAAFLWYLYSSCGEDTFQMAIRDYYAQWKFKHPVNGDLHDIFKKYTGDRSDWFFDQGMVTNEKINYEIRKVELSGDELILEIRNKGEILAPIYIETFNSISKLNTYYFEPIQGTAKVTIPYESSIRWIAIDNEMTIPDVELSNNYVRIDHGKKIGKPFRFNYFSSFENPYRNHIYYAPAVAGNYYDGPQFGMVFHNYGFIPKKTEWFLIPMYSSLSVRPAFFGSLTHTHYFKKNKTDRMFFKLTGSAQSYNISAGSPLWAFQITPQIRFIFDRRDIYSPLTHEAGLKNQFVLTQVDPSLLLNKRWKLLMQNVLYYKLNFKKRLWEIQNTVSLENVYDFEINYTNTPLSEFRPGVKLYNELKVTFTYFKRKSTIQLRIFAGTFLFAPSMVTDPRFRLSGWNGPWDYAFNEYYIGRSEADGFLSQQASHHDGDFKINTFVGQSNTWMLVGNLEWDIPMIYAGAYFDGGTYGGAGGYPGSQAFAFNAGFYLRTPDRSLQIYFPLIASTDIVSSVALNTNTYWERIRFTVQLQNLNFIPSLRRLFI